MAKRLYLHELHLIGDMVGILTCLFPFIKNKTGTEIAVVYRELNIFSRKEIPKSHYDSSNIELCQCTKTSEATCKNITVSPVVENSKTKTQRDLCDRLVIATDSIKQDGNAANEGRFQLNSNSTSERFLDCPSKSKQPNSKLENVKRFKRSRKTILEPRSHSFQD